MYEGLAAPVDARRECTEGRRGFGKGSARGRPHHMALGDRRTYLLVSLLEVSTSGRMALTAYEG
jgi:hypothetical protein